MLLLLPFTYGLGMEPAAPGPDITVPHRCNNTILSDGLFGTQLAKACEDRFQIAVSSQKGATCAYHALFNGCALAELAQASSPEEQHIILNHLSRDQKKKELFGAIDAPWQKQTYASRANTRMAEELRRQVKSMLKNQKWEKITETPAGNLTDENNEKANAQLNCLFSIAEDAARHLIKPYENETEIVYTRKFPTEQVKIALQTALKNRAKKATEPAKIAIYTELQQSERNFLHNFELKDLECTICIDVRDWLHNDEIKRIYHSDSLNDTFKHMNAAKFLILGGGEETDGEPDLSDPEFLELQRELLAETGNTLAVLVLYQPGHWMTVVANKVGSQRQFFIADSLCNVPRIRDSRANKVIQLLGGKELPPEPGESAICSLLGRFDISFMKKAVLSIIAVGALYLLFQECTKPKTTQKTKATK